MIITKSVSNPADPIYTFPQDDYQQISNDKTGGFVVMIVIFFIFFALSILGYLVEYYSLGNKKN